MSAPSHTLVDASCSCVMFCMSQEKDFEFTDSEVKLVKRAVNSGPSLISDDEDLLADDVGSGPDEGSATDEPPFTKTVVAGYPGKQQSQCLARQRHPVPHKPIVFLFTGVCVSNKGEVSAGSIQTL